MKRYEIRAIRVLDLVNTEFIYRENGNGGFFCETNDDTKIESDFICFPRSTILSMRDTERNLTFDLGEATSRGIITGIRLNNARIEVKINTAIWIPISEIQKTIREMPVKKVNAIAKTAPSRSQVKDEIAILEEAILERNVPLRLEKFLKKNLPSTLKEFIQEFFETHNVERNTIFVEDKTVQTDANRRRSLSDIFIICRYYYPECTLKELLKLLYVDFIGNTLRTSLCSTIKKRVWYLNPDSSRIVTEAGYKDEYGQEPKWYLEKIK